VPGHAVMGEQGVQEVTKHALLRGVMLGRNANWSESSVSGMVVLM
jgi:hypothetical protein